ncbi:hypothetical protein [uncultured Psychroserpens sp.]|uniref:hypothetical protein n=1 Tax=uncultured Psychroserpens sp. TaxID=255436 RepID=UPI00262C570D|nr:hypothetical protein [uncultured Psychroserpens sp.]
MKFRYYYFLLILISLNFSYAQKSAPVAGDAAALIDILKKDYNSVSPDNRAEEIMKDRAKAMSIFNSYMATDLDVDIDDAKLISKKIIKSSGDDILDIDNMNMANINTNAGVYDAKLKAYEEQKNKLQDIKSLNISGNGSTISTLARESNALHIAKSEYLKASYYKDVKNLVALRVNYDDNNYIKYCIELFIKKYATLQNNDIDTFAAQNYQSSIQKSLPFLGGDLALETLIDGLSRFLAKRIKEELTTYVVDQIKDNLNNPKPSSYLNELMVLLPVTTDYIKSFEADQVLNFIDEIKQYIEGDLNNLLSNATHLKSTPRFQAILKKHPDLDFAFEALEIYPNISKIKNPIDYFDLIGSSRNISRWSDVSESNNLKFNLANGIKLSNMLAHSLTITEQSETRFVSTDFISNYGSELNFYLLFTGFLNQQNIKYYDIKFKNGKTTTSLDFSKIMDVISATTLDATEKKARFLFQEISQIAINAEKIHNDALAIKKAKNNSDKVDIKDVHGLIKGILEMALETVKSADKILDTTQPLKTLAITLPKSLEAYTSSYFKIANTSNDIVLDIHTKKFSSAIIKAIELPSYFNYNGFDASKIYNLQQQLLNVQQFNVIRTALVATKIPKNKDERQILESNLLFLKAAIQKKNNANLNTIITSIDTAIGLVQTNASNKAYKAARDQVVSQLKTNFKAALIEFASINIDNTITTPLTTYLNNTISDPTVRTQISKVTNTFIESLFSKVITSDTISFNELKDDEQVKEATRQFRMYIEAYLPELVVDTFRIKDQNLIKIIHFINDIAISENDEDVEAAISAFALPSGSYALKKKRGDYIAINSFPGLLTGFEQRSISDLEFNTLAFTAPVGIYTKLSNKHNLGLFVPIIDIAAPVRFRLDDDNTTNTLPEFNFKNIIAPGLYITWSPLKGPFSFNFGAQYGPELEVIETFTDPMTGETSTSAKTFDDSFRIGIGVTLDIPLFSIYNRPRN